MTPYRRFATINSRIAKGFMDANALPQCGSAFSSTHRPYPYRFYGPFTIDLRRGGLYQSWRSSRWTGPARAEQFGCTLSVDRPRKIKALATLAARGPQKLCLALRLHAFGDDFNAEFVRNANRGAYDRRTA